VNRNNAKSSRIVDGDFSIDSNSINWPKKLTIEEIREHENFKSISDIQALEIIEGLYQLSIITYNQFKNNEFGNF